MDKPTVYEDTVPIIWEANGPVVLDREYANQGESEGWLEYTGYYQVGDTRYSSYRHI